MTKRQTPLTESESLEQEIKAHYHSIDLLSAKLAGDMAEDDRKRAAWTIDNLRQQVRRLERRAGKLP